MQGQLCLSVAYSLVENTGEKKKKITMVPLLQSPKQISFIPSQVLLILQDRDPKPPHYPLSTELLCGILMAHHAMPSCDES